MHTGIIGGPRRHIFHDFAFVPLSKSCFPPRAGSIFSENGTIFCKKKVLEAWKAQRKQQIVYEIDKIVASMHTLIFADWALGAKNARRSNISMRAWKEKIAIGTGKRAKRANTITKNALIEAVWGSKR